MARMRALTAVLAAAILAPQAAAPGGGSGGPASSMPSDLQATYVPGENAVTLAWQPPTGNQFTYTVWRDGDLLGSTGGTTFTDPLPVARDPGYLYFVSAVWQDNSGTTVGAPAVVGLDTLSCEVVTVSTSWDWPYVHAHLHEECLGATTPYDKDATWSRP